MCMPCDPPPVSLCGKLQQTCATEHALTAHTVEKIGTNIMLRDIPTSKQKHACTTGMPEGSPKLRQAARQAYNEGIQKRTGQDE